MPGTALSAQSGNVPVRVKGAVAVALCDCPLQDPPLSCQLPHPRVAQHQRFHLPRTNWIGSFPQPGPQVRRGQPPSSRRLPPHHRQLDRLNHCPSSSLTCYRASPSPRPSLCNSQLILMVKSGTFGHQSQLGAFPLPRWHKLCTNHGVEQYARGPQPERQ